VITDRPSPGGDTGDASTNGHDRCFICGYSNPWSLGLRFHGDGDGSVTTSFRGHPGLQGYEGMLHGGVIAALLDSAMTHCLFHSGVRAVTGDLHVRFVEPVPCESTLAIQARIASRNPPLFCLRAEMRLGDHLLAWAEAKFLERQAPGDDPATGRRPGQ
jgi:uncharacterized protein (TIGR00369 family)